MLPASAVISMGDIAPGTCFHKKTTFIILPFIGTVFRRLFCSRPTVSEVKFTLTRIQPH